MSSHLIHVLQVSKEHFPNVAVGYDDPRVTTIVGDGESLMKTDHSMCGVLL